MENKPAEKSKKISKPKSAVAKKVQTAEGLKRAMLKIRKEGVKSK